MGNQGTIMSLTTTLKWNNPRPDPAGEPEGEITHPDMFDNHASLVIVAKEGMKFLVQAYPGHMWAIQINERGRMFNIFNHHFHDIWGYTIRADEVEHDITRRRFITAGGELLERFGHPRGHLDLDLWATLPKDAKGNCLPILSDLEHAAARKVLRKRTLDEKIDRALREGRSFVDAQGRTLVSIH
jgi:hypothetical protein